MASKTTARKAVLQDHAEIGQRKQEFTTLAEAMYLRLGKWQEVALYTGLPLGAFQRRRIDNVSEERVEILRLAHDRLIEETAPVEKHESARPIEFLGKELRTDTMEITPEMALQWLDERAPNRSVSDIVVQRYARDMKNGEWKLNGESIVFDKQGRLMDGQHRLWAVITAGASIKSVVVWGTDSDAIETIDSGRKRRFSDALQIEGSANAREVAAAARWLRWEKLGCHGKLGSYTSAEMREMIEEHPLVAEAASMVIASRAKGFINKGMLVWVVTRALEQDREKAMSFLDALSTGIGLNEDHPCYVLREKLIANKSATRKLDEMIVAAYLVKVWTYYRDGRAMKHLRYSPDREDRPESFPTF